MKNYRYKRVEKWIEEEGRNEEEGKWRVGRERWRVEKGRWRFIYKLLNMRYEWKKIIFLYWLLSGCLTSGKRKVSLRRS